MQLPVHKHFVQYYETDQMGIVHHSNYIRWMEEARCYLLAAIGMPYSKMEEMGIIIPVLSVDCKYKAMSYFEDSILVEMVIEKYDGLRFDVAYTIKEEKTGEVRSIGHSSHCFLDKSHQIISLKRTFPEVHKIINDVLQEA